MIAAAAAVTSADKNSNIRRRQRRSTAPVVELFKNGVDVVNDVEIKLLMIDGYVDSRHFIDYIFAYNKFIPALGANVA
jgi:hypothetical protein